MFSTFYKLITAVILFTNQCTSSFGNFNYQDTVNLKNDHYEYLLSSVLSRYKRHLTNDDKSCQIPNNPLHTKYNILEKLQRYKPGDYVHAASVLEQSCDKGYNLVSPFAQKYSICVNGKWEPSPTTCSRTCPSLIPTTTTAVKCKYQGIPLANCLNPVHQTTAILSCNIFYEEASLERNPIRVCRNGRWTPSISQCYPSCGMKRPKGIPNLVNGTNATPGDYPWQVGVYNIHKELICGGSIIAENVVLSAAHCFTDYDGNVEPTTNYFIAAGKYYRQYDDDRDQLAQYSKVLEIHVPERYKGQIHFFANDIAIIVLTDPFTLSQVIQPVCVELNEESQQLDLSLNSNGVVTGWGQTEEGLKISEELKELIVPYIPYQKCLNGVPENFRRYITSDKICGGYTNSGTSVCGGDSGGALIFKNVANNRYYVKGIVSTSPATSELACDSNTYSVFTEISHHVNFVRNLVQYYQTPQSIECTQEECTNQEIGNMNNCIFPNFPPNGKYINLLQQNDTAAPGDYVPIQSVLTLSCNTGYEVNASNETESHCVGKGQWMPPLGSCRIASADGCFVSGEEGEGNCININSCKPMLDYLQTSATISNQASTTVRKYNCGFEGRSPKVCCYANKPIQISMKNTEMHSIFLPNVSNHRNINLLPNECGLYSIKKRIVGGKAADLFEFPWMALLIFNTSNQRNRFKCSGTIINDRYILTGAACLTSDDFTLVGVRVGEYNFTSEKDCEIEGENIIVCADPVQDIEIEEAIPHPNYNRSTSDNDIGLLRLRTPMQLKRSVQPICLPISDAFKIENFTNTRLQITGWGSTRTYGAESSVLIKAEVAVASHLECTNVYNDLLRMNITDRQLCAVGGGAGTCSGDAGGPLQGIKFFNDDLQYVQFGIGSFGGNTCETYPTLFTRIHYFMDWILDTIKI